MNVLRNDPGIIKYRDIARILRERINSRKYPIGEKIPSESSLEAEFRVSKITVRNAVSLLANEGLLRKMRGRGNGTLVLESNSKNAEIRKGLSFGVFFSQESLDSSKTVMPQIILSLSNGLNLWHANINLFPFVPEVNQFEYVKNVIERNIIDGIFLMPMGRYTDEIMRYLADIRFPFVFMHTCSNDEKSAETDKSPYIFIDELASFDILQEKAAASGIDTVVMLGIQNPESQRTWKLLEMSGFANCFKVEKFLMNEEAEFLSAIIRFLRRKKTQGKNLVLISSLDILSYFDCAVSELKLNIPSDIGVVVHRHYANLPEFLDKKYDLIDRSFTEMGKTACGIMEKIIDPVKTGEDFSHAYNVTLKGIYTDRGTVVGFHKK